MYKWNYCNGWVMLTPFHQRMFVPKSVKLCCQRKVFVRTKFLGFKIKHGSWLEFLRIIEVYLLPIGIIEGAQPQMKGRWLRKLFIIKWNLILLPHPGITWILLVYNLHVTCILHIYYPKLEIEYATYFFLAQMLLDVLCCILSSSGGRRGLCKIFNNVKSCQELK